MPVLGERRRYAAPSPAGGAPVCDGIDGGDANAKEDGGGAVVGSIGRDMGVGGGFYGG